MIFKDYFSRQAAGYTQFRPRYPAALIEFLAAQPLGRARAWDCGTGNGQAAVALAAYFDEVVASDPSAAQIAHAAAQPRVRYCVAAAEHAPLAADSVDLITVAQALHWFDRDRFYGEARRVARAGAVLAAWSYGLARVTPQVDAIIGHLYEGVLGDYWPPERRLIERRYADVAFPFAELPAPRFWMTAGWSLAEFVGYLRTWSSVQKYVEQTARDPLEPIDAALAAAWGAAGAVRQVTWPLFLRVGRVR